MDDAVLDAVILSYGELPALSHVDAMFLPSRARVIEIVERLRCVTFPGFFEDQQLTADTLRRRVGERLLGLDAALYEQVRQALRYDVNRGKAGAGDDCDDCDVRAREITDAFLRRIPGVRELLSADVAAVFEGDPAATHPDEAVFCYPGLDALFTHRYAHELYKLGVPMLPRIMSEAAHNDTGIDIHPGATIGPGCFIDHGTGIVIGETAVIGRNVKLYQGVTLGALSLKGGHDRWVGQKRHPTIEDDVTIYGGAVILGGATVIGRGAVIGGAVFLTESVPAGVTVISRAVIEKRSPRGDGVAGFDPGI